MCALPFTGHHMSYAAAVTVGISNAQPARPMHNRRRRDERPGVRYQSSVIGRSNHAERQKQIVTHMGSHADCLRDSMKCRQVSPQRIPTHPPCRHRLSFLFQKNFSLSSQNLHKQQLRVTCFSMLFIYEIIYSRLVFTWHPG